MTKAQLAGYFYEIVIKHLLDKNGFKQLTKKDYPEIILNENGEIAGRGSNHQIDYTGVYTQTLPFIYPLRLLAECKLWEKKISKSFIREYLGVYKDISENYFSNPSNTHGGRSNNQRFIDVAIIFAANGFDQHAEELAWAHGINLVSHYGIKPLFDIINRIRTCADSLITRYGEQYDYSMYRKALSTGDFRNLNNLHPEIQSFYDELIRELSRIKFLIATTEHGRIINLVSTDEFPIELFNTTDIEENCTINYNDHESETSNSTNFYLQFLDPRYSNRKFYFNASKKMLQNGFKTRDRDIRINQKQKYFTKLTIYITINDISRIITVKPNYENVIPLGE
ncbi:MAG: hypothetical protein K2Y14_13550 [Burkholderiales bacterium]|nr:hypothetical protein [Burkholderiales bacterium]